MNEKSDHTTILLFLVTSFTSLRIGVGAHCFKALNLFEIHCVKNQPLYAALITDNHNYNFYYILNFTVEKL
jgi:hypothetical protein